MKNIFLLGLLLTLSISLSAQDKSIYDFKMNAINGDEIDFSTYKGKKLLIVNTASKCGYTPQYEDLQKLHEEYADEVTILGFPSNDFMRQEPGTNDEIVEFCKINYGVTFQLFEKSSVKGKDQNELYSWLSDPDQNGWNDKSPGWNFSKYLIDEKGKLVKFYRSKTNPLDDEIVNWIKS